MQPPQWLAGIHRPKGLQPWAFLCVRGLLPAIVGAHAGHAHIWAPHSVMPGHGVDALVVECVWTAAPSKWEIPLWMAHALGAVAVFGGLDCRR